MPRCYEIEEFIFMYFFASFLVFFSLYSMCENGVNVLELLKASGEASDKYNMYHFREWSECPMNGVNVLEFIFMYSP